MNGAGRLRLNGSDGGRRDRDDDLLLFRELFKREEQHNLNLLDPESVDFENTPGNQLYRIPSAKKGGGSDFISLDGEKNDFDWLKTPPATPLFASLEMEATNNPNMMYFKEAPKPSRFAAIQEEPKPPISPGSRSASSQYDPSTLRSETPSRRSSTTLGGFASGLTLKEALNLKHKPKTSFSNYKKQPNTTTTTNNNNSNASSKSLSSSSTSTPTKQSLDSRPRSRGVSPPVVRSRVPATLSDFADEALPNLVTTGRAISASRGRPGNQSAVAKIEAGKPRRQSCSPGATRRRPAEFGSSEDRRVHPSSVGNLVMGSQMVDKMMNARRSASGAEEIINSRQSQKQRGTGVGEELSLRPKPKGVGVADNETVFRPKSRVVVAAGTAKDVAGYGRLMTRSSLDVAFLHMEIRKTSNDNVSMSRMKSSTPVSSTTTTNTNEGLLSTTLVDDARNPMTRRAAENKSLVKKAEARKRYGLC